MDRVGFDGRALHAALDRRRREEGLSWQGAADAIWAQSAELNRARPGSHPIATSTIANLARRGTTSCQHALFYLRWIRRVPEDYLTGPAVDVGATALPACGPDRRLRWAVKLTWAALDERRRAGGWSWADLAEEIGCTPSQLTGMRAARFGADMRVVMGATQWLARPAADFVYAATW